MAVAIAPRRGQATLDEVLKKFGEAKKSHDAFVRHYESGERSYRGVLVANSEAAKWRHKYHPPYAFNLLETIVGNQVDPGLPMDIKPDPKLGMSQTEAELMLDQVETIRDLLKHEYDVDEMDLKQRPFYLTAAIGGRGVLKSYWNYTKGAVQRQGVGYRQIEHPSGGTIQVPTLTEIRDEGVLDDRSTCEVVDPRDFIVHESARDINPMAPGGAQYVIHRCWYSFEQLKMMERAGFFSNVDALKDTRDFTQNEYKDRGSEVFQQNRQKDLVEVLEYWGLRDGRIQRCHIGNRTVVLRDWEDNPFWHGQYPFVIASSMPQPFSTIGMSDIELIAELQEMLWEIANQRFDNTELINNAIYLIRSDIDDPDSFEYYPGARWLVDDPSSIQALVPPYQLIQATLETESLLKGDLQNITQAMPFASATDSATVDQKTATGATIVMNAAQQAMASKKFHVQQGLRQEAELRLKNCQQFISDWRLVAVAGPKGQHVFRQINPLDIQGDFMVDLRLSSESQMRQERRAEASSVLQMMQLLFRNAPKVSLRGMLDPGQTGEAGSMVGIQPTPAGPPGMQGLPQPGGPSLGVTSGQAVDASQPSSAGGMSLSPAVNMQRLLAARGGFQRR